MGAIVAVSNQKGGVGKSTTAVNLAACLAEKGKKVLLVDLDPQGNASSGLGIEKDAAEKTVYDLLLGGADAEACTSATAFKNLSVISANMQLAGAEVELMEKDDREFLLRNALSSVAPEYDYVLIDCPPSLSLLTLNALTAADSVLIPVQCEYYALEGLTQLLETIDLVRNRLNKDLALNGILFTMFDVRTNLASDVVASVKDNLDVFVYRTLIPRNVRLAEAPSYGMPVTAYDSGSNGAAAYRKFAKEFIKRRTGNA